MNPPKNAHADTNLDFSVVDFFDHGSTYRGGDKKKKPRTHKIIVLMGAHAPWYARCQVFLGVISFLVSLDSF